MDRAARALAIRPRQATVLRKESESIVVPSESVQWDGENTLVFVRDKRFFEEDRPQFSIARSVRVGVSEEEFTEIIAGVLPGEVVARRGQPDFENEPSGLTGGETSIGYENSKVCSCTRVRPLWAVGASWVG